MSDFSPSIIEYLGKVDGGILVIIGGVWEEEYFEGTFFYNENQIILTMDEELENKIGDIKNHPKYEELVKNLISRVIPYSELINSIDPVDFGRWVSNS